MVLCVHEITVTVEFSFSPHVSSWGFRKIGGTSPYRTPAWRQYFKSKLCVYLCTLAIILQFNFLQNQFFFCYEKFNFQWNPILLQADLFKERWLGPINFGIVSHFYLGSCNLHWYKLCFMSTIKICERKLLVCQFLLYKVIAYRRGL